MHWKVGPAVNALVLFWMAGPLHGFLVWDVPILHQEPGKWTVDGPLEPSAQVIKGFFPATHF